jgi:phosphoribosylanthranilate isomerase
MTCSIKICGITGADDARMISESGIDYLGVLVNVRQSPRSVGIEAASEIIAASKVPVLVLAYDHCIDDLLLVVKALHPAGVQLAGSESETYIASLRDKIGGELWKTVHLTPAEAVIDFSAAVAAQINRLAQIGINRVVLDTAVTRGSVEFRGGTGERCDWSVAAQIKQQVDMFLFLAGGINPGNVRDALLQVNPDGIDLSSGVERATGKKDIALVQRLVAAAKVTLPRTP